MWLERSFVVTTAHILLVGVVVATIVIYLSRQKQALQSRALYTYWPGLLLVWAGLITYVLGTGEYLSVYKHYLLQDVGIMLCLLGLVVTAVGWACMRVLWLPLVLFSLVIVRFPAYWSEPFLQLLQQITNWLVVFFFNILNLVISTGIKVDGSQILVPHQSLGNVPLNFGEASLNLERMPLYIAVGLAVAFICFRWWLQRLAIILVALPLGIVLNSILLTVRVLYFEMAPPALHSVLPVLLIDLAGLLFVLVIEITLLMHWGWVWQFAVIRSEDGQEQSTDTLVKQVGAVVYASVKMGKAILGLASGFGLTVLVLGFIYWIVIFSVSFISRSQHLVMVLALLLVMPIAIQPILVRTKAARSRLSVVVVPVLAGVLIANVAGTQLLMAKQRSMRRDKHAIQLARLLDTIPLQAGGWNMENQSPRLSEDIEAELGTSVYLMRDYRNTQTNETLQLHIAFYPSDAGVLPYSTEQAFAAGGLMVVAKDWPVPIQLEGDWLPDTTRGNTLSVGAREKPWLVNLEMDTKAGHNRAALVRIHSKDVPISVITLTDPYQVYGKSRYVLTFYITKEAYMPTSDEVLWAMLPNRDEPDKYYCKVQITLGGMNGREGAQQATASFLSDMLPYIMSCMPGCEQQADNDS